MDAVEIEFVTVELPRAAVGKGYAPPPLEVRVSGTCTLGGMRYSVVSGALPPGLQLSWLGYFSGTASRLGSFDFMVRAANGCSWTNQRFTIIVSAAPVLVIKPERLTFVASGQDSPPAQMLFVSAAWPDFPYELALAGGEWLTAVPAFGRTPRVGSLTSDDIVYVRVGVSRLKPGHYSATLTFSARQATPVVVMIELAILTK